jgi:hypothetical protein
MPTICSISVVKNALDPNYLPDRAGIAVLHNQSGAVVAKGQYPRHHGQRHRLLEHQRAAPPSND